MWVSQAIKLLQRNDHTCRLPQLAVSHAPLFLHPHKNLLSIEKAATVTPIVQMEKLRLPRNHRAGEGQR